MVLARTATSASSVRSASEASDRNAIGVYVGLLYSSGCPPCRVSPIHSSNFFRARARRESSSENAPEAGIVDVENRDVRVADVNVESLDLVEPGCHGGQEVGHKRWRERGEPVTMIAQHRDHLREDELHGVEIGYNAVLCHPVEIAPMGIIVSRFLTPQDALENPDGTFEIDVCSVLDQTPSKTRRAASHVEPAVSRIRHRHIHRLVEGVREFQWLCGIHFLPPGKHDSRAA